MDSLLNFVNSFLPERFNPGNYFITIAMAVLVIFVIGGIFRLCFGQGSLLNSAVSSTIAIISVYAITILVYSYETKLNVLFDALPFISISGEQLTIFPIISAPFQETCAEIVEMLVLAFLMNLMETWLPKGKGFFSWFGFRFLSLCIALCLHYCINLLLHTLLMDSILEVAPLILLGAVALTFLLACLKVLIGGVLFFINPLLAIFYCFFFQQVVGKQLLRAMVTTLLFGLMVYALNTLGYTVISIATVALATFLPVILIGLALLYIISKFF